MLYLSVLNKMLHCIYLKDFWIYHSFKICQSSEYIRVLNMSDFIKKTLYHIYVWQGTDYSSGSAYTSASEYASVTQGFLKKCCIIDAWQDSKHSSGSEHTTVLNMPGLHKALKKMLHYRYLIGFWISI